MKILGICYMLYYLDIHQKELKSIWPLFLNPGARLLFVGRSNIALSQLKNTLPRILKPLPPNPQQLDKFHHLTLRNKKVSLYNLNVSQKVMILKKMLDSHVLTSLRYPDRKSVV